MTAADFLADELAVVALNLPTVASRIQSERTKSCRLNACLPDAIINASKNMFNAAAAAETPAERDRTCVVCWEADRDVRFGCGHAVCCRRCVVRMSVRASPASGHRVRADCPVCKEAIDTWVELGAHLAEQPTYRAMSRDVPLEVEGRSGAVRCRGTRFGF